jgi:hypothetical protein
MKERDLPKSREELLIRISHQWDATKNEWRSTSMFGKKRTEQESKALFNTIHSMFNEGVEKAEDTLAQAWEVLKGYYSHGVEEANEKEREVIKEYKEKSNIAKEKLRGEL